MALPTKVGQRVICRDASNFDARNGETLPVLGMTYTVRAFTPNKTCLWLREIINAPAKYVEGTVECSFRVNRFEVLKGRR